MSVCSDVFSISGARGASISVLVLIIRIIMCMYVCSIDIQNLAFTYLCNCASRTYNWCCGSQLTENYNPSVLELCFLIYLLTVTLCLSHGSVPWSSLTLPELNGCFFLSVSAYILSSLLGSSALLARQMCVWGLCVRQAEIRKNCRQKERKELTAVLWVLLVVLV